MSPADLAPDELDRVHKTLQQRFARKYPNVRTVTLGMKVVAGSVGASPVWAVCFYVDKKLTPKLKDDRIPETVHIRVKRGNRYLAFDLPTDVINLKPIGPTGVNLIMPNVAGPTDATGGFLLSWRVKLGDTEFPQTGLVTVGHACSPPAILGAFHCFVTVPGDPHTHVLVARTDVQSDGIDASLTLLNVTSSTANPAMVHPLRSRSEVATDFGRAGRSLRADADLNRIYSFVVASPIMPSFFIPTLGIQTDIVRVEATSALPTTFLTGTSGSVWVIDDPASGLQVAMIQLAADLDTFTTGYGQVIESTSLDWALRTVKNQQGYVPGSLAVIGGF